MKNELLPLIKFSLLPSLDKDRPWKTWLEVDGLSVHFSSGETEIGALRAAEDRVVSMNYKIKCLLDEDCGVITTKGIR